MTAVASTPAAEPPVPLKRPLAEVAGLRVRFGGRRAAPVVDGISFTLNRGECLALVGESGSGKSVTARTLVGLTGAGAHVEAGRLRFDGQDLSRFSARTWRQVRGARSVSSCRTRFPPSTRSARSAGRSPSRCGCTSR